MSNILRSKSETTETETTQEKRLAPLYEGDAEEAFHRGRLYALLSIGLDRPDDEFETLLEEGVFAADIREAAEELGDEDIIEAAEEVTELAEQFDFDELYYEWGSLFGVEEGVTVSPYELTYLPGPLLTTTRDLADITGFYRAFGLQIAERKNDRADHVVFQTEFLSHLALREAHLRVEDDTEGIEVVVDSRQGFVEDHLGRWFWRLADEVSHQDDLGFHTAVANLLSALAEYEIGVLNADPDWVPDHPEVTEWTEDVFGDSGRGCGGCGMGDGDVEEEMGQMDLNPPGQDLPMGGPSDDEQLE